MSVRATTSLFLATLLVAISSLPADAQVVEPPGSASGLNRTPQSVGLGAEAQRRPCGGNRSKEMFFEGKRLIERNVSDSTGGNREVLEEGIRKIRRSRTLGHEETLGAYQLMIDAQTSIAFIYADPDFADKKKAMYSLGSLYEDALEIYPDNVELLYHASSYAPGGKSREEILRRILELDPEFSFARFSLGQLLILEGKDKVAGEAMMREAYRNSEGRVKEFRGRRLRAYLIQEGRHAEAQKILEEIKDLPVE